MGRYTMMMSPLVVGNDMLVLEPIVAILILIITTISQTMLYTCTLAWQQCCAILIFAMLIIHICKC